MVDCNVTGSYTSNTSFHRGVGNTGPSKAKASSPPRGAVISFSTLTLVFSFDLRNIFGEVGIAAADDLEQVFHDASRVLDDHRVYHARVGEINPSAPMEAGAASQEATPCRSEANVSAARFSVLPPTSRRSIIRYSTSPTFPKPNGSASVRYGFTQQLPSAQKASRHPAGRNGLLAGRAASRRNDRCWSLDSRHRAPQFCDIRTGHEHVLADIDRGTDGPVRATSTPDRERSEAQPGYRRH